MISVVTFVHSCISLKNMPLTFKMPMVTDPLWTFLKTTHLTQTALRFPSMVMHSLSVDAHGTSLRWSGQLLAPVTGKESGSHMVTRNLLKAL